MAETISSHEDGSFLSNWWRGLTRKFKPAPSQSGDILSSREVVTKAMLENGSTRTIILKMSDRELFSFTREGILHVYDVVSVCDCVVRLEVLSSEETKAV